MAKATRKGTEESQHETREVIGHGGRGRDYQRSRLYRWEETIRVPSKWVYDNGHMRCVRDEPQLTIKECQLLVDRMYHRWCTTTPVKVPKVIPTHKSKRSASYHHSVKLIKLPVRGQNAYTVIHEAAHGLERRGSSHGEHFVAMLCKLIFEFYQRGDTDVDHSEEVLRESAKSAGLKVAEFTRKPANSLGAVAPSSVPNQRKRRPRIIRRAARSNSDRK